MSSDPSVRVRFAPSPTGPLHIGGARTALYNWLFARGRGGEMVLRIEDTDRERSTPKNVEQILDALHWLELDWDEGPVSQYERADRHREALERLLESGAAYRDPATGDDVAAWKKERGNRGYRGEPSEDPNAAVRLHVPDEGDTVVADEIRGEVRFPNDSQDDFVIARRDGSVLYNFAVAVDDADMAITHVIRGDDHLSNTPKQLLVMEALGDTPPRYAHLPLLNGPDGKKLSKRHGAASVQELRDAGYLPAAVRNYMALLGWGTQDDTTILSTEELIERFDLSGVGRSSAIFDEQKLRWLNGRYMREMDLDAYTEAVARHIGREPDDRLRAAGGRAQEQTQKPKPVFAADRVSLRRAQDRRKGVAEGDEGRGAAAAGRGARGAAWSQLVRAGRARNRTRADPRRARREAGKALSADPGRDHGDVGIPGDLRIACSIGEGALTRAD